MNNIVKEYGMKSPSTGNDLTDAVEFNLMFPISIGPSGRMDEWIYESLTKHSRMSLVLYIFIYHFI